MLTTASGINVKQKQKLFPRTFKEKRKEEKEKEEQNLNKIADIFRPFRFAMSFSPLQPKIIVRCISEEKFNALLCLYFFLSKSTEMIFLQLIKVEV